MLKSITRRQALTAGFLAAGMMAGPEAKAQKTANKKSGNRYQERAWSRGPDPQLVRDLKPGPTQIRLACHSYVTSLYSREGQSITETVKKIRELGYTSTGISGFDKWLTATDSEIAELKTALKKYDVTFFNMMSSQCDNVVHPDNSFRDKGIKSLTVTLEAAERCGALSVDACMGSRSPDTDFCIGMHPENWTEKTWKLGVSGLKQILKDTAGYNAVLSMEAVITTPLDGPIALKRLMEDVGDPRLKVTLDPANMFTIDNYYHSTEMINWCFDLLGEDIACCHAKDTLIEEKKMLALIIMKPAGKGIQDYETYLTRMSHLKYPRTLLLEFATDEEYPEVKAFLEKTASRVGVKIYA